MNFRMLLDTHVGAWFLAVVLFIIAYILVNKQKEKAVKVLSMIVRLFFLVILLTGGIMLYYIGWSWPHVLKTLLGLATIGFMEVTLSRKVKGEPSTTLLILFIISLAATVFYGYYL